MESILSDWLVWFIIAVILLIAEIFTPGFLLACFSIGAFVSGIAALFTDNLIVQLFLFVITTVIVFFTIRPLVIKHMEKASVNVPTNVDALIGKEGQVIQTIDSDENTGRVRVGSEDWRGVSVDNSVITEGTRVIIEKIEGTRVIVSPVEPIKKEEV